MGKRKKQQRRLLKAIRRTVRADEAVNDMSDPIEIFTDPDPLPPIGSGYLWEIRHLYRLAFGDRLRDYQVCPGDGIMEIADGSAGDVSLDDPANAKLVAVLLRFAAHLNNATPPRE